MKSGNRSALMVALALGLSATLSTPSPAQKGEVAATSAKIAELSRAGKYAEAIPLAQGQLQSLEKKYGPFNVDVAGALNNLALLYGDQGRDAEAEPLYKRAIAIQEKVRGLDSSEVAPELNNLADLYERQSRLADAEPLYQRAAAIREAALGPDHPDLAISLNNLALLYQGEGRNADALSIVERMIGSGRAQLRVALPVLFAAQRGQSKRRSMTRSMWSGTAPSRRPRRRGCGALVPVNCASQQDFGARSARDRGRLPRREAVAAIRGLATKPCAAASI